MADSRVKFIHGLQANYDALAAGSGYDSDMIYFITDTKRIYKGSILIAEANKEDSVVFVTEAPSFDTAKENTIYVYKTDAETLMYIKGASEMEVISGGDLKDGAITSISQFDGDLVLTSSEVLEMFSESDDTHIATVGAVAKAVKAELEDYAGGAFTSVEVERVDADEANPSAGTILSFGTADGGQKVQVRIADLFLTGAEYDATTHELKLSVQGSATPVVVDLAALIPEACSTEDVKMTENIVATVAVGNIKKGEEIEATDLQSLLLKMLSSDSMPTVTQPSLSLSGTDEIKSYEVGTEISKIDFTATLAKGSYSQTAKNNQVSSGITPTKYVFTCIGQDSQTIETSNFSQAVQFAGITVEDSTSVSVSCTATYTGGDEVPLTYLGKTELDGVQTTTKRIAGGTKSANKGTITGYRNCWYGYKTDATAIDDPTAITVDQIKALTPTTSLPKSLTATGMKQMFFAVPATKASGLSIMGANPPAPQSVNGPIKVQIGGVNNYSPIEYNLFYVNNASATSGSDTYTLTWS